MKYAIESYKEFLRKEIDSQKGDFEKKVTVKATVLKERGEVFVGKFLSIDVAGIAVFKIPKTDRMPRKNTFWTASYLSGVMCMPRNWGEYSWLELMKEYQQEYSDALCVYLSKSDSPDYYLVGIKGLSLELIELIGDAHPIIAFGPKYPPLQYYANLECIASDCNHRLREILDYDRVPSLWNPQKLEAGIKLSSMLLDDVKETDSIVIQGPPGTGKTTKMAQLAAELLGKNNSVLVTALTNQALMALAKKDELKAFVEVGRVSKTCITIDELKELPNLQRMNKNECNASHGKLSLATFYISSGWAAETKQSPYDYVIMDEASQAFLPMIAAVYKLGKKVIWIGDQQQLSPITEVDEDIVKEKDWSDIVNGFDTLCRNFNFKSYMLCNTYRMTQRGAECTGVFYGNSLNSISDIQSVPTRIKALNTNGGPVLCELELEIGHKAPDNALKCIFDMVKDLYEEDHERKIAVLCKLKDSVSPIQKYFTQNWDAAEYPGNIKIETVDRIQGMTVDFCVFFIPHASLNRSLEPHLFNVATSRAVYNTIIVSCKNLLAENMSEEVRKYLLKAQEDKFVTFNAKSPEVSSGNSKLSIVGKINLSQFERKRTELVEGKENIYILDTNAFVNCPNIISRIGKEYKVVVPAKVLEELDNLKRKPSVDKKILSEAAKNINQAFVNNYSYMDDADVSLLPEGFDKQNPDCMILSVALKYKNEHPILLTSDKILQARANGLGITTISLQNFLRKK